MPLAPIGVFLYHHDLKTLVLSSGMSETSGKTAAVPLYDPMLMRARTENAIGGDINMCACITTFTAWCLHYLTTPVTIFCRRPHTSVPPGRSTGSCRTRWSAGRRTRQAPSCRPCSSRRGRDPRRTYTGSPLVPGMSCRRTCRTACCETA